MYVHQTHDVAASCSGAAPCSLTDNHRCALAAAAHQTQADASARRSIRATSTPAPLQQSATASQTGASTRRAPAARRAYCARAVAPHRPTSRCIREENSTSATSAPLPWQQHPVANQADASARGSTSANQSPLRHCRSTPSPSKPMPPRGEQNQRDEHHCTLAVAPRRQPSRCPREEQHQRDEHSSTVAAAPRRQPSQCLHEG
jgi:hypothetical protein